MAENDDTRDADHAERCMDQVCLRLRCPNRGARALAVAEARPVERDDAVFLRRHGEEAARLEILDHAAIAVQQHKLPTLDVSS